MHRFIYLIYAGLVIALIYMVVMPFVLLYDDKTEVVGEVSYYIPEEGLQSHYHKEVELTKGKYSSKSKASDESE